MLKKILTVACLGVTLTPVLANAFDWQQIYIGPELGYSFGGEADLKPQNPPICATNPDLCYGSAPQDFANTIHNSMIYGAHVGYQINQFFAAQINYDYRGGYSWQQYSSRVSLSGDPNPRVRSINDIHSQTLTLDLLVTPNMHWKKFDPFLDVGAGYASNRLDGLTSLDPVTQSVRYVSSREVTSLAWQVGAGVHYTLNPHWFVSAGYRFIDLGKFQSGDYQYTYHLTIPRLQDNNVHANEIYMSVNYRL